MFHLYRIFITLLALILSPVLLVMAVFNLRGMRQRLGFSQLLPVNDPKPVVWFHAASMGEVVGMAAVVHRFVENHPTYRIFVTTMTATGLTYAERHIPEAAALHLLPVDIPYIINRFFRRLNPVALILLEGELWPSLLAGAEKQGCPAVLINARMSDRSYPRNKFVRPLFRAMIQRVRVIGVQSALDAERYIEFGATPDQVKITGNVKFDQVPDADTPDRRTVRRTLMISDDTPIIMAGCPRPVEEEHAVLEACRLVKSKYPNCTVIWAPRHLERVSAVEKMLTDAGLTWRLKSRSDHPSTTADVLILDTMGELAEMYAAVDMAFVGATLVPLGGHNLLEPAMHGVPVLFGPHTENVRPSAEALLHTGGGRVIQSGRELAEAWISLLENPADREKMGTAAREAVQAAGGALDRTMDLLEKQIFND